MDDNKVSNGIYLLLLTMRSPIHGYGAAKKINERSNGRFKIPPGTLYGFLNKMLSKDLIYIYGEEMNGSKKRTLYKITQKGEEILNQAVLDIKLLYEITLHEMEEKNDKI